MGGGVVDAGAYIPLNLKSLERVPGSHIDSSSCSVPSSAEKVQAGPVVFQGLGIFV